MTCSSSIVHHHRLGFSFSSRRSHPSIKTMSFPRFEGSIERPMLSIEDEGVLHYFSDYSLLESV